MKVIWASRKVAKAGPNQIVLKFDAGTWKIEVFGSMMSLLQGSLDLPADVMDELVAKWPEFRRQIQDGKGANHEEN
jgi:hypothetical protein